MILAGHQREWLSKKTFSTKIYCQRNSHISSKTFKILIDNKISINFYIQTADEKLWYNAFEEDIAVANFYFSKPTTMEYRRSVHMELIDLICQFGGIFGLCLGFSMVSLFELFYWISIRLCRNISSK